MPIPRLPETHHKKQATKNAGHVKKNSAATAPIWNRAMKVAVTQLMPSFSERSFRNVVVLVSMDLPK